MAKELPYFKFTPTEWLVGKISFQPLEVQGAFVQCCCMFWKNSGALKVTDIDFRVGKENIEKLISYNFIKEIDGFLRIDFLESQLISFEGVRNQRVIAGAKGGVAKATNSLANANDSLANSKQNLADKDIRHKTKDKELNILNNSLLSEIKISDDKKFFLANDIQLEVLEGYADYFIIAEQFRKLFIKNLKEKNSPSAHQTNATFKSYVSPVRLMIEKDEATMDQLREAYKYLNSLEGEFWKSNILSTEALRKQISKLLAKKNTKVLPNKPNSIQEAPKRKKEDQF